MIPGGNPAVNFDLRQKPAFVNSEVSITEHFRCRIFYRRGISVDIFSKQNPQVNLKLWERKLTRAKKDKSTDALRFIC